MVPRLGLAEGHGLEHNDDVLEFLVTSRFALPAGATSLESLAHRLPSLLGPVDPAVISITAALGIAELRDLV